MRAVAWLRLEPVHSRHPNAMMLAATAAASRHRHCTAFRQWCNQAGQQNQENRNGRPTPHTNGESSTSVRTYLTRYKYGLQGILTLAARIELYGRLHCSLSGGMVLRYLLALLAITGIVVSVLALRVHYSTETAPCSINEKWDCGIVNHSPYAVMYGIPVAALGIAGYLLMLVLALARSRALLLVATLCGMAFALYLTHIEASVLGVWCLYCVISQGVIAAMALLAIGWVVWYAARSRSA